MSGPHATNANMKPLRKGWEWIPLGKYVENHDGRRIPISKKERESRSGLFPYYGASGVIDTIDGFTHDGEFLLIGEDGANLLTRSKPLAFLTKGKVWVNNHAHVLRCRPGYSNAYLAYFINSIDLSQYVTGTAQPKLSQSMMNKILIPVAPPEQQVEIVAELEKQFSRLDEAVANLQRVKANLKRYKASVLKDAVEGRLVPTEAELARRDGRSFETGEQLLQRILEMRRSQWSGKGKYKEPTVPDLVDSDLPEGWIWATMEQLGQVQLGKMLDKQKHLAGEPYLYLRNINVRWGAFDLSDLFEMNFESHQLERFGVRDGDVLVCEGGEPARAAVWRMGPTDIKYQKALHRVRFDGAFVPELLMFALEHLAKSGALEEMYGGSTIKHFTREVFVTLCVPVPPISEQHRIVAEVERRLTLVQNGETEVDANLKRAQALRQSTLAKSFSHG